MNSKQAFKGIVRAYNSAKKLSESKGLTWYFQQVEEIKEQLRELLYHGNLEELSKAELFKLIGLCSSLRPLEPFQILMYLSKEPKKEAVHSTNPHY